MEKPFYIQVFNPNIQNDWHDPMDYHRRFATRDEAIAWIKRVKKVWAKMKFRIVEDIDLETV